MARLTVRTVRRLLDAIAQIYVPRDSDGFASHVMLVGRQTVAASLAVYDEIDVRRRRHRWISDPPQVDLRAAADAHASFFREHPFVVQLRRTGDVPPLRLSDFLTRRQYHETGFYREAYRAFGIEYQIGFTLSSQSGASSVGLAFNRTECDFSDEERFVFELLRPHLLQAYRNAELITQLAGAASHVTPVAGSPRPAVVMVAPGWRLVCCPPRVRRWLADYYGARKAAGDTVPDALRRWLTAHRLPATRDDRLPPPRGSLVAERDGRRLTIRIVGDTGSGQLLAVDEQPAQPTAGSLCRLGLTPRQDEILLWVARGKTNAEIGAILGLSSRTVHKHTEHIFVRLGVETRTAAAARAWETMTGRTLDADQTEADRRHP
jgi:DNA-binding CsgD family transcriptional regulator